MSNNATKSVKPNAKSNAKPVTVALSGTTARSRMAELQALIAQEAENAKSEEVATKQAAVAAILALSQEHNLALTVISKFALILHANNGVLPEDTSLEESTKVNRVVLSVEKRKEAFEAIKSRMNAGASCNAACKIVAAQFGVSFQTAYNWDEVSDLRTKETATAKK